MAVRQVVRYRQKDGGTGTKKQRERVIQVALTRWLNRDHPEIDFYNDWSAGAFLTYGQNSSRLAMTSNSGWVDMFFPEPRNGYPGLFIELKREGIKVYLRDGVTLRADPQVQKEGEFLQRQRDKGYVAEFAIGLEEAKRIISKYFGWPYVPESLELF